MVAVVVAGLAVGLVLLFGPRALVMSGFTGERGTVAVDECAHEVESGPRGCRGQFTPDGALAPVTRVSVADAHGIGEGQHVTVYREGTLANQREVWRLVLLLSALLICVVALVVFAVSIGLQAVRRQPWRTWEALGRGFATALGVGVPVLVLAVVLYLVG
ncbi:hypothetical protein GCM10010483_21380 [Actinokineospora diospyrosa]